MDQVKVIGDVLRWCANKEYNCEPRTIEAIGGSGLKMVVGDILLLGTGVKLAPIGAATGANAIAVLLENIAAADDILDKTNVLCLVRGPALLNGSQLAASGSATQIVQAKAALKALGMVPIAEPTTNTQTT